MNDCHDFLTGSVSGSGTGSLDSESRDPVPDLESLVVGTGPRDNPTRTSRGRRVNNMV